MLKEQGFTQTMITRIHAWDLYFDRDPSGYLPFRSFIFSKLDGVYPISEKGRNYLLETLGSEFGPRLRVARLGTEPLQGKPYVREAKILRILSISKIIPLKRLDLLIESLGIAQQSISIVWHHLGGDDAQTKSLAESKLKGVDFTFFAFQGKARYYQQLEENTYDLFINLSTKEGLPVSMMECMSLGIPVLATDVGAVSEIVDHEKNGWLISVDSDAKSIAEKICSIALLTEEEMQQTRQAAYLKWDSNFNSIRNYSDFSEKLLKF
ncbi:MAG: glycosyltransferase, partial [Bacteroidia bacterium]|nr:glycosyltransferase [Bacteroidia bacterium]